MTAHSTTRPYVLPVFGRLRAAVMYCGRESNNSPSALHSRSRKSRTSGLQADFFAAFGGTRKHGEDYLDPGRCVKGKDGAVPDTTCISAISIRTARVLVAWLPCLCLPPSRT